MSAAQADCKGVLLFRHRYQVDVVAYQAVSQNADPGLIAILLQYIQLDTAVSLRVKDDLSICPTLSYLMGKSGQYAPGTSRHTLVE